MFLTNIIRYVTFIVRWRYIVCRKAVSSHMGQRRERTWENEYRERVIILNRKVIKESKIGASPLPPAFTIWCQDGVARGNHLSERKGERGKMERPAGKRDGWGKAKWAKQHWQRVERPETSASLTSLCLVPLSSADHSRAPDDDNDQAKQSNRGHNKPASISSREAGWPIISWHAHKLSGQWAGRRLLLSTTTHTQRQQKPGSDLLLMNGAVPRLHHCTSLLKHSPLQHRKTEENINRDRKDNVCTGRVKQK